MLIAINYLDVLKSLSAKYNVTKTIEGLTHHGRGRSRTVLSLSETTSSNDFKPLASTASIDGSRVGIAQQCPGPLLVPKPSQQLLESAAPEETPRALRTIIEQYLISEINFLR